MVNLTTRLTRAIASLILAVLVAGGDARADILITFEQVGGNVVETGSGAIDLTGLTISSGSIPTNNVDASAGATLIGTLTTPDVYSGLTGPGSFGSGGAVSNYCNWRRNRPTFHRYAPIRPLRLHLGFVFIR